MYCPTSQFEKDLKNNLNKPLPSLIIPLLEPLAIDSKFCNTSNSFKNRYKLLFPEIFLLETPIIKSK